MMVGNAENRNRHWPAAIASQGMDPKFFRRDPRPGTSHGDVCRDRLQLLCRGLIFSFGGGGGILQW